MLLNSSLFVAWNSESKRIGVWRGRFEVRNGTAVVTSCSGSLRVSGDDVEIQPGGVAIARIDLEAPGSRYGANAAILRWISDAEGFSVLPVMVPEEGAIAVPDYGVMIGRSLESVISVGAANCGARANQRLHDGLFNELPQGREIGWDAWASRNKSRTSPVVLGLSRDQRLFEVNHESDTVKASLDFRTRTVEYYLCRASVADQRLERSLEAGVHPILHARENVGELLVEETMFVSFADRPLKEEAVRGTPVEIAHLFGVGPTFPDGMAESVERQAEEYEHEGEIVFYLRVRLTNCSEHPLLAPQRFARPFHYNEARGHVEEMKRLPRSGRLDERGVVWTDERPFSIHRLNGEVPESSQPCLLLAPGESMTLDSILSHRPEGLSEATQKNGIDFDNKLAEASAYWQSKIDRGAAIVVPEKRLENFWKAGHAHLELVTLGEQEGPLLPKVGIYTAIGSESIPMVEFYDSIGDHEVARRCLAVFLDLQHENGRINTYLHYDIETGAVLYLMGRHFAYTRDVEWVRSQAGAIRKAVSYLRSIRHQGAPSDIRNGLIAGACADPVDTPVAFMLNAYNAAGLAAAAELLEVIGDEESGGSREVAQEYTAQLRAAIDDAFARGPLLPSTRERWVPTCAPWAGGDGVQAMGLDGESCFTHGTYMAYDALLGPLYAVYTGVIPWDDRRAEWLLEINHRHMNRGAIAESQPYYSRHPEVHLLRGEREAFLNAFYSGITALADRETFTFQEHLFSMSPHKTHEEGWALMQMRRMLWLEAGEELRLLSGIPVQWLEPGAVISLERCGSYFGEFSFQIERSVDAKTLLIRWEPNLHTRPGRLRIHLPGLVDIRIPKSDAVEASGAEWITIADPMQKMELLVCLG